jgi:hypothetical protein
MPSEVFGSLESAGAPTFGIWPSRICAFCDVSASSEGTSLMNFGRDSVAPYTAVCLKCGHDWMTRGVEC